MANGINGSNGNGCGNNGDNQTFESNTHSMVNDQLHLASFDHPGMMLTNTPFNGGNFLGWSRTIKMALGAKLKLGFIDGSLPKPASCQILSCIHNLQVISRKSLMKDMVKDELHSLNGIPVCFVRGVKEKSGVISYAKLSRIRSWYPRLLWKSMWILP
ncbi:retrovirus-related pol polyprotein from transposon TNT 1-94 [Tanacetum coccineum]